jgi:hypothetical protein
MNGSPEKLFEQSNVDRDSVPNAITIHLVQALNPSGSDRARWTHAIAEGGFARLLEELDDKSGWKHNASASDFKELIGSHVGSETLLEVSYENLSVPFDLQEIETFPRLEQEGVTVQISDVRATLLVSQSLSVLLLISFKASNSQPWTSSSLRALFEKGDSMRTDTGILEYLHETKGERILAKVHEKLRALRGSRTFSSTKFDFGVKKIHAFVVIPPSCYSDGLENEILSLDNSRKETFGDSSGEIVWVGWSFSVAKTNNSAHEAAVLASFVSCQGLWFYLMHVMGQVKYHSRHLLDEKRDAVKLGAFRQDLEAMLFLLNDCQAVLTRNMKYASTITQDAISSVDASWDLNNSFQDTEKRLSALCERASSLIDDIKSEVAEKQNKALYVIAITQVLLVLSLIADYTSLNLNEEHSRKLTERVELYGFAAKLGFSPAEFNNTMVLFLALVALALALYGFGLISFGGKKRR